MNRTTIQIGGKDLNLKASYRNLELLNDLTGIDLLDPATFEDKTAYEKAWTNPRNLMLTIYALAGGDDTGWSLDEYKRIAVMADVKRLSTVLMDVMKRDMGVSEEGGSGNAKKSKPKTS